MTFETMPVRLSALVSGDGRFVNAYGAADKLAILLSDRVANGEALPGEQVARLPRSVTRYLRRWGFYSSAQIKRLLAGRARGEA